MKARSKAASFNTSAADTSWVCYSPRCPDFIVVNPIDLTVRVDGTKTWGKDAAGLFILNILTQDKGNNKGELLLLEEFMIAIEYTSEDEKDIKITMPWDEWVSHHSSKGTLPYSVGKQTSRNKTESLHLERLEAREDI